MLSGIDHNPGMSGPDGQVAGLWMCDLPETLNPSVEVGRWRVVIRETGALVKCVDQVRAIRRARVMTGAECDPQNRQALGAGQGPGSSELVLMLLCKRGWDACQADYKQEQGSLGRASHSVL